MVGPLKKIFFLRLPLYIVYVQCSVMKSEGNSFCDDDVLDSIDMASRDENSILDQMCSDFFIITILFIFTKIYANAY